MLYLACACAFAQALLPVPALLGHVVDQTGTLNAAQLQGLESTLADFEAAQGAQIAVLLVSTTAPEDIASYANRVGNTWKIGRRDIGDGLILIVVKNDRKLRIEVAKTLEGAIPDLAAKRVIDEAITPHFKAGDFAGGLNAGVGRIMALVKAEGLPEAQADGLGSAVSSNGPGGFEWADLLVFLFFGVLVLGSIVRQILGTKLGSMLTGGVVSVVVWTATTNMVLAGIAGVVALAFVVISANTRRSGASTGWHNMGSGSGGWSDGGDGSGGFSSGGGGNFGGGGASGGW
jgi:uncharacterized protein